MMEKLAEQFSVVTGASKEIGLKLLEVTNGNLEMAVTMQIDGLGPPDHVSDGAGDSRNLNSAGSQTSQRDEVIDVAGDTEDNIRPPIPRRWDILNPQPYMAVPPRRRPRGGKTSVFDPFRDFAAETRQQEEMLRTGQMASSSKSKRKTLEDLFRPPIDLMFSGSFHSVRDAGQSAGKWLMVNIQNTQEFSCQKLNRDVWSDPTVKSIIRESFVFWQVFHDSEDGLKYSQFYDVTEYPYVAILDPRTGELMVTWHHLDTVAFCDLVMDFLTNHPCFDATSGQSPPSKKVRRESIIDADEERQLKAAIDASLEESCQPPTNSCNTSDPTSSQAKPQKSPIEPCGNTTIDLTSDTDQVKPTEVDSESEISVSDDGFSFSESDSEKPNGERQTQRRNPSILDVPSSGASAKSSQNSEVEIITINSDNASSSARDSDSKDGEETSEVPSGEEENEVKIVLRFPDGRRKEVNFKPTDTLRDLQQYVIKEGFSNERYELVTNFPLRRLCMLDIDSTLVAAKLFPRETVFIQER